MQRALLQYRMPKNAELVNEAYKTVENSQKNANKTTQNHGKRSNMFAKNKKYGKIK